MAGSTLFQRILTHFPYEPSSEQRSAMEALADFLDPVSRQRVFILRGYAGTGKTSLLAALVRALHDAGREVFLMAPTGRAAKRMSETTGLRAAKVMAGYSGTAARTIHKQIYTAVPRSGGGMSFILRPNKSKNAVFLVDEASMLTDRTGDSLTDASSSLLDDLVSYVFHAPGSRLILVGDRAQLPPVGYDDSPALEGRTFENGYGLCCTEADLTRVYRQDEQSAILQNATRVRQAMESGEALPWGSLKFRTGDDFVRLEDGYDIQSAIEGAYSQEGLSETILITRSNKRAGAFNAQIRSRVLLSEGEIAAGDLLMVAKNNYFWVEETSPCGFIANGDLAEVMSVRREEELYGMRFARVELSLTDYPQMPKFEALILRDTLYSQAPALPEDRARAFFEQVMLDYEDLPPRKRFEALAKNEYYNAIQVKFGYAVTCHKAQGGGWDNVLIEQVWMPEPKLSREYLRWLYTAITRARKRVYLIGFPDEFFE